MQKEGELVLEQFTYVKRGYDPEEVDRYIDTLEQVVQSYKEKDNAIKNAIISAQVAADNMVKNAKAQADEYKYQIAKELDKVTLEIERQRMRIRAFQDVYSGLVRKYLAEIQAEEMSDLFSRLDEVDKLVARLKEVDIIPPLPHAGEPPASGRAYQEPPNAPGREYQEEATAPPALGRPYPERTSERTNVQPLREITPAPGSAGPPPLSPPKPPVPSLSLGPGNSPSLSKTPYAPPQVVARANDDGNYRPS